MTGAAQLPPRLSRGVFFGAAIAWHGRRPIRRGPCGSSLASSRAVVKIAPLNGSNRPQNERRKGLLCETLAGLRACRNKLDAKSYQKLRRMGNSATESGRSEHWCLPLYKVRSYASLLALPSSRVSMEWAQSVLFPQAEAGRRIVICHEIGTLLGP
jgi:hypothetical protein